MNVFLKVRFLKTVVFKTVESFIKQPFIKWSFFEMIVNIKVNKNNFFKRSIF